ncbi:MAG: phosphoenolpyruvate carboxykinase (ATP) [Thermoanaerobaculia bacterium]|nr:phosphoenolpyruvate carboxykinase (ATP) [Thermoanaerobaculia bacterium]
MSTKGHTTGPFISRHGLDLHGIEPSGTVHWNLPPARLYEEALRRGEARVAAHGPLVASTGPHTGRSPNDRYVVEEPSSKDNIWWGAVNVPVSEEVFERLETKVRQHLSERDLFVFDGFAGADERYRLNVRVVNENAWQNLFARNMFVRTTDRDVLEDFRPDFTVLHAPSLQAEPAEDGIRSGTFILLHFGRRLVLIGGTQYAGEIKKSIFTVMNYLLPKQGIMAMHCSANYSGTKDDGADVNAALFFGLSGTGKTTLSADPSRSLVGDDEHGWSADGVFNFEGGCYAKVIRLDPEGEPEIYATTRRFGTILENVVFDEESRQLDLDDDSKTENTRASYPVEQISNADLSGTTGHPKNVVFLTCDAFGVLPPISRLTEEQAMYHFLSGYTAKVAGTEKGVTEPTATFSTCFGAPFMPRHPGVYAELLGEKIRRHGASVWLVNTGWTGGPHGVGSRMKLRYTRRMVRAALAGELDDTETATDAIFGVAVPQAIEGVPSELLIPRNTWPDPGAFDAQAKKLAQMFVDNFGQFEDGVSDAVKAAAPKT